MDPVVLLHEIATLEALDSPTDEQLLELVLLRLEYGEYLLDVKRRAEARPRQRVVQHAHPETGWEAYTARFLRDISKAMGRIAPLGAPRSVAADHRGCRMAGSLGLVASSLHPAATPHDHDPLS